MNQIIDFYNEKSKTSQCGWQAACWESESDQYERFVFSTSIMQNNISVLDVGCGYGDFYNFLKKRYKNFNYTGIDISEKIIKKAKENNSFANFECADVLDYQIQSDCVFALGTFNLKVQSEYIEKYIKKCYELSKQKSCIILTSESTKEKCDEVYFYDPKAIFNIAYSLCNKIIVNTASIDNEIVLLMYK